MLSKRLKNFFKFSIFDFIKIQYMINFIVFDIKNTNLSFERVFSLNNLFMLDRSFLMKDNILDLLSHS